MQHHLWSVLLPILFLAYSLPLFLRVYATTQSVIDEEFHLRQGLHYCNKRFNVWDRKITTFPGLYFVSLVLSPFDLCSVLGLRLISLAAAAINVVLLYKIRCRTLLANGKGGVNGAANNALAALDAFTLAALPPMYFFSHVYYTDMLALTTVLCCYYHWMQEAHLQAAVYAASSVLMRQTNVVWVGMLCGITALDVLTHNYAQARQLRVDQVSLFNFKIIWDLVSSGALLWRSLWQILRQCCYYLIIILPFVAFVFVNGSIVLGDKQAHRVTLHVPQIFYFALFTLVFAVSNVLQQFRIVIKMLRSEPLISIFVMGVCVLIVKWNTLVHPYLLADNRHYIFYIWQRFYARLPWFRYAMVPVYVSALLLLYCGLRHMRPTFRIMYTIAVAFALCFQQLLELRYFLIPYVLFRLHTPRWTAAQWPQRRFAPQWLELAAHIVLNALTFYIFFTKEVIWPDYKESQRIIW